MVGMKCACKAILVASFLPTTLACLKLPRAMAQHTSSSAGPTTDTSVIDPDGTARVTRVVPVPKTISPEAQRMLARPASDKAVPQTLAERRSGTDAWQTGAGDAFRAIYPVDVQPKTIAGVPVRVITPPSQTNPDRVLINLHGGGFNSDSGSLTESIPVAALAHVQVVAVLYRLAPEHTFPAGLDDAVAVYRELLKTHRPQDIAVFGTSAGAILTAELAVQLHKLGVPEPAALGIFSGLGDFSKNGDSTALFALNGFSGHLDPPVPPERSPREYVGHAHLDDPILSPIYADLHGLPPTLFITSTRDSLLSGTTTLHRAFLRAGNDARLVVFEALPHAFWNDPSLPESREAHEMMARFLGSQLGK